MFDLLALLLITVSTGVGFARGALREFVGLAAFALAALAAVVILPASRTAASLLVHPRWLASVVAVAAVFILAYLGVRAVGAALTTRIHATTFEGVERAGGAAIGLARGLIILGVVSLLLESVPWPGGVPRALTRARSYPVARASARMVKRLAPQSGKLVGGLTRFIGDDVAREFGRTAETSSEDERHRLGLPMERAR